MGGKLGACDLTKDDRKKHLDILMLLEFLVLNFPTSQILSLHPKRRQVPIPLLLMTQALFD